MRMHAVDSPRCRQAGRRGSEAKRSCTPNITWNQDRGSLTETKNPAAIRGAKTGEMSPVVAVMGEESVMLTQFLG